MQLVLPTMNESEKSNGAMKMSRKFGDYPPPDKRFRQDVTIETPKTPLYKSGGSMPSKYVLDVVGQVSQENLRKWVYNLSAFHTRHTKSSYIDGAAAWLIDQFKRMGYSDVVPFSYTSEGYNRTTMDFIIKEMYSPRRCGIYFLIWAEIPETRAFEGRLQMK